MKTLGLALGSGGSRGIAHIGFLQALEDAHIRPSYISGCSMGSVVGSAYAAGLSPEYMRRAVCSLRFFDLVDITNKPGGVLDTRKIRKLLARYIGERDFADLKIPFSCVAVDMLRQEVIEFSSGSVIDAVVASSCIPSVFKPVEVDGMRLVDGGVLKRVPVEEVKRMGADVVVAVDVLGKRLCKDRCPNALTVLLEVVDIMDNARTHAYKTRMRKQYDLWLEPELGDMSQYSFRNFNFAYLQGYELGRKNVDKIKRLLEKE
ncbi:MAG: patatin-like phospholipase family protein [Clostridia bacterium]|nr:patatin-like phospholipase family protein [Clostridia bacterium]